MAEWGYACLDCPREQEDRPGKVRRGLNTKGTAETLATIHEVKTGHRTELRNYG